jgi:hemoglobin
MSRPSEPTIYEFAGGDDAFLAFAAAFHERCMEDPELNHPFSHGTSPLHVEHLAAYWAEVFGGPGHYSNLGGHSFMLSIHAGQGASEDLSKRFVACFMQAADDAGLPRDEKFRDTIKAYIEWATGEVDTYQARDSRVAPDLPMPHWSWDGLAT